MSTEPTDETALLRPVLDAFLDHAKTEEGVYLVGWKGAQEDWFVLTDQQRAQLLAEWQPAKSTPEHTTLVALRTLADTMAELAYVKRQLADHVCNPTQWAYDAACAALHKHRQRADTLATILTEIEGQAARMAMVGSRSAMQDTLLAIRTRAREAVAVDRRVRETPPQGSAGETKTSNEED